MADPIAEARRNIHQRLRQLDLEGQRLQAERQRLENALTQLNGASTAGTRSRKRTATTTRRRRGVAKRAPRGQRQEQFLAILGKKPGIKVSEAAKEMGVNANQVYGLAHKLHRDGRISKRRGGGYAPKQ